MTKTLKKNQVAQTRLISKDIKKIQPHKYEMFLFQLMLCTRQERQKNS